MANTQSFERTDYQQVKADLHRKILDRLDLEKLGKAAGDSARDEVLVVIRNAVNSEVVPLSFAERERLSREILDETAFFVIQYESLLAQARSTEVAAKSSYVKARAALDRATGSILEAHNISVDAAVKGQAR